MSMKLSIIEWDENYVATIVKLPELNPINGLDNLMTASVFGYNCLVGKDSNPDILYVFFPAECELSKEFLSKNNLYKHSELNIDNTKKWFFEDNGRVKAVKFKGIVSSWFLIPVSSIAYAVKIMAGSIKEGYNFHSLNWVEICRKYRNPESIRNEKALAKMGVKQTKYDRVIPTQFRLHQSTPQFLRFREDFKEGDRIIITEKLHWTSAVFSNVLTKSKLWILEKIAKTIWIRVRETEYFPLYSSRTVIKNKDINPNQDGGFYWEDIWGMYAKLLEWKIEKGITLYGEIVGYTPSGAYIQKGYHYGCKQGESRFYCYRMTYTTPDGVVIEFTDSQIRQYCELHSIDVVPLLMVKTYYNEDELLNEIWDIEVMCSMNQMKVPREGVVIRRDGQETYSAYKLKSQLFLWYETAQIDAGTEDTEEAN